MNQEELQSREFRKTDPIVQEQIARIVSHAENLGPGNIIEYGVIEAITGECKDHERSRYVAHQAMKRIERDRGIPCWVEPNQGYKLLTFTEAVNLLPEKRLKRSLKQTSKLVTSMSHLATSNLSMQDRRVRLARIEGAKNAQKAAKDKLFAHRHAMRATPLGPVPKQRKQEADQLAEFRI